MALLTTPAEDREAVKDSVALAHDRAAMLDILPRAYHQARAARREREAGQTTLFDLGTDSAAPPPDDVPVTAEAVARAAQFLVGEMELIGMYVSGHPLMLFGPATRLLHAVTADEALDLPADAEACVAGRVLNLQEKLLKTPNRQGLSAFAAFALEGYSDQMRVICWPEAFANYKKVLRGASFAVVKGPVTNDKYRGGTQINAREIIAVTPEDVVRAYHMNG